MAQYYFGAPHQASLAASTFSPLPSGMASHNNHHGNRSRRSARYSSSQHTQKHVKSQRTQKESADLNTGSSFRKDYEAARSFDIEDDEVFCPWHLLTDDDVSLLQEPRCITDDTLRRWQLESINTSSSDRASSSGSGSPETSPLQPQLRPSPAFPLPAGNQTVQHAPIGHMKIYQPLAQRTRNAIPIVDPNSRNGSPPTSISPARQVQKTAYNVRRW